MHRKETPDRPTSIDGEPAGTNHLPHPLAAQERSHLEAETWNWNAVTIYPGGQGPGVPFPDYTDERVQLSHTPPSAMSATSGHLPIQDHSRQ